jgi:hypothetical protein
MTLRVLFFLLASALSVAQAQVWQLTNPTTVRMTGTCSGDNDCYGLLPSPDTDLFGANAFVPGGLGFDYAVTRGADAKENTVPPFCQAQATWSQSEIFARAILDGDNTDLLTVYYGVTTECLAGRDIDYLATGHVHLQMTVTLDITGGPPGFPVVIDYSWDHFGGFGGPSEAVDEDSGSSRGTATLTGRGDLLQGQFVFGVPTSGGLGFNKKINQADTLRRHIGGQIQLTLDFEIDARVAPPHPTPPMVARQDLDRSTASQWGKIALSLGTPIITTPPDSLHAAWLEYSVDIGGDAELSDPTPDGNEVYDPGDAFVWGAVQPPGGVPGIFDDTTVFAGVDPPPSSPDLGLPPVTRAPVGSGILPAAVADLYFDLDGIDYLDFDLSQFAYGPGDPSIGPFLSPCIFSGENVFVSYDDDSAEHYAAAASVPVSSRSPWNSDTYGTLARRDEVTGLVIVPFPPGYKVFEYPFVPESGVSPNMVPDPDILEDADDDVDGLDFRDGQCSVAYISADHEAKYGLDPGIIYEVVPGGLGAVIDQADLGILPGTDIDAFEFAWIFDASAMRNGLALLFSVDDNDPMTPADESGGLDPRMIYASFLNGANFPYLANPLIEDVDAIACWGTALFSQYTTPPACPPPDSLTIRFDPANNVLTLDFYAPNDGTYEIYSTTSPNASFPDPAWILQVTITAPQGHNSWDGAIGSNYTRYTVRQVCP